MHRLQTAAAFDSILSGTPWTKKTGGFNPRILLRWILSKLVLKPDHCLPTTIYHLSSIRVISTLEQFTEHGACEFCKVKWRATDANPRGVVTYCISRSPRSSARFDEHALWNSYTHPEHPDSHQESIGIGAVFPTGRVQQPKQRGPLKFLHHWGERRGWRCHPRQRYHCRKASLGQAHQGKSEFYPMSGPAVVDDKETCA